MRFFLAAILCSASCTAALATEPASPSNKVSVVPAAAPVVEITDKAGPVVRINRGNGLKDAKVGDSLKPGDEVFAGTNSSVVLFFTEAQCSYKVKGSKVYKVTEKAPCKAAAAAPGTAAAGLGAGLAAGGVAPAVAVGVGALAVAGAVGVIATTDNNNNNKKPTTPD